MRGVESVPRVFLLPMVPYIWSPVTCVLLAFLARHVAKNKVPEKEAVPEPQEKFKARKLNSQFAIFT